MTAEQRRRWAEDRIRDMLADAGLSALEGAEEVVAAAILWEGSSEFAPFAKSPGWEAQLAGILMRSFKQSGWIPADLCLSGETVVTARQMWEGEEVSEDAGLTESDAKDVVASMLADVIDTDDLSGCSAICCVGESRALGVTFFGLVAR